MPRRGLRLDGCLKAAREERRDGAMEAASRRLLGAGADRLPALWVARGVFWGEDRVGDAAATARCTPRRRPLAARWSGRAKGARLLRETRPARICESNDSRGSSASSRGVAQDRVVAVGLGEQQLEVGVGDLVLARACVSAPRRSLRARR